MSIQRAKLTKDHTVPIQPRKYVQTRINQKLHCESWRSVVLNMGTQHKFGANGSQGLWYGGNSSKQGPQTNFACVAESPKLEEVQHINKPSAFLASLRFCQYVAILDLDASRFYNLQLMFGWASTLAKAHVSFDSSVAPKEFRPKCRTELFSCGIWGPWKEWDRSPCQRELLQK